MQWWIAQNEMKVNRLLHYSWSNTTIYSGLHLRYFLIALVVFILLLYSFFTLQQMFPRWKVLHLQSCRLHNKKMWYNVAPLSLLIILFHFHFAGEEMCLIALAMLFPTTTLIFYSVTHVPQSWFNLIKSFPFAYS